MNTTTAPILIDPTHPARGEAEALIAQVYAHEYGAKVKTFAKLLIALQDETGTIVAAAGLRLSGDFFSEIYLDRSIESVLSDHWCPPATRDEIAEVTTLAAIRPNASHALFSAIIGFMRSQGIRFAFFTVTERLHHMLKRTGIPAEELARATPDRIDNAEDWGHYYATCPRVVAIHDAFISMPATEISGKTATVKAQAQLNVAG
jgi:hypothetical protein